MTDSPTPAVNHHADHPGFPGVIGLVFGVGMLMMGRDYARLAVDLASVSDADRVVDIGCGPGGAARAAAQRGAKVVGVDPAPMMLRLASVVTRGQSNITWLRGSAEALPLPSGCATVAWSLRTVHHWKDVTAGLGELRRVLAPAGRFLVMERQVQPGATGLASHGWIEQQAEAFRTLCCATGFDGVRVDQHPAGRGAVWVVQGSYKET
jgi:ubiquinone/menaquinone biosynthesis C-methylase UbiE